MWRALAALALVAGLLALLLMLWSVLADWVYHEGTLPALGAPAAAAGLLAWCAAVILLVAGRDLGAVVALAAAPALLLTIWLLFWV